MPTKKATYNLTPEVVQKLAEIAQARGYIKSNGDINQSLTLRLIIEEAWEREMGNKSTPKSQSKRLQDKLTGVALKK